MSKRVKNHEVNTLVEQMKGMENCVLFGYKGITAEGAGGLRKELRDVNVSVRVVKNSLAKAAFSQSNLEELSQYLDGETAIAIAEDPVAAPKLLEEWRKKNSVIEFHGGMVEGKTIGAEEVKALAEVPSRDELLSMLLGSMQAPATGLASVLKGLHRKVGYALNALIEKKEQEGA